MRHWQIYQSKLMDIARRSQNLTWSGYGRFDSMGHSFKFCVYSMFSPSLMKIVHFELLQVIITLLLNNFFLSWKHTLTYVNRDVNQCSRHESLVYIAHGLGIQHIMKSGHCVHFSLFPIWKCWICILALCTIQSWRLLQNIWSNILYALFLS